MNQDIRSIIRRHKGQQSTPALEERMTSELDELSKVNHTVLLLGEICLSTGALQESKAGLRAVILIFSDY
jgi:hypothetical protein